MEQENTVRLVEEEKFGWTILSTVRDGELVSEKKPWERNPSGEKLGKLEQTESVVEKEKDEPFESGLRDFIVENTKGEQEKQAPDEEEKEEEEEDEGNAEEEEDDDDHDEDVHDEDEHDDGSGDVDGKRVFPFGDPRGALPWGPKKVQEASPKFGRKQTLVQQQPVFKHGLMWRVSLVATLGFFGWVMMNGLSGKNFRCLKLHPCSIKEGEPVVNSL